MKTKVLWVAIGFLVAFAMVLASCGGDTTTSAPATTTAKPVTTSTTVAPATTTAKPITTSAFTVAPTSTTTTSKPAPLSTTQAATGTVKRGGILKVITGAPTNLGIPWEGGAPPDLWLTCPAVETLCRPDENGNYVPWLATGWTIAPDYKSVTFNLRKGVKFHDGTPFNAEAVKYNFETNAKSAMPEMKAITSVDVIDEYTAKVNLSKYEPHIWGLWAANRSGWMVSPTAAKTMSAEERRTHPVGTGPFKYQDYKRDVYLKFTRFDDYWQAGKPYLDGIEYQIILDNVTAIIALKAGVAQVHYNLMPKDAADLQKNGFTITGARGSIYQWLPDSANANSPWSKLEVRQAAQHALDTVAMAKAQALGWGDPYWNQVFPKFSYAYDPTIVGYPYDPAKAKALLTKAGYPNGFTTSLYCTAPPLGDLETSTQNFLQQVGIKAEIKPLAGAAYGQASMQGWNNGLYRSQSTASVGTDPGYQMSVYMSSPAYNWVSVARPDDFKVIYDKAMKETDWNKRAVAFKELCKNIIDTNALIISTWNVYLLAAKTPEVQGDHIRDIWTMTWTPEDAWLNK